jgi:hypothetical protein
MIEEETSADGLDFEALRYAIENRDADALLDFYSDDAQLRIVNSGAPAGPTFELRGRAEIERYLHAVCDQDVTCAVEGESVEEGRISFSESCEYKDVTRVLVKTTLELRGGRISYQLDAVERR